MRHLIKRPDEQTNLWPVLAMHAEVGTQEMLGTALGNPEYRAQSPEELWQAAKIVAIRFGMKWFVEHLNWMVCQKLPAFPLLVPTYGSGVMFLWNPVLGIRKDGTLVANFVTAFSDGMVFDPCFIEPIPAQIYDAGMRQRGGCVVDVIFSDTDLN